MQNEGELIAWFYYKDYLLPYEAKDAIKNLVRIIKWMRDYEDFKVHLKRVSKGRGERTVDEIEIQGVGITDEFTEEKIKIIYKQGEVKVYRL